ncbi:regulator [Anaerobacillus alkalidiazotrophicus]|uniref:Regulator n=1 Tax=Anaerobacillus alkalidiazotrophicus TaxID=472963 RepID=A0A1S2M242_9BACI|nr:YlbF family regulator [Anaerobacillus alkalidiazotrophicus]OIJ17725.1 regulator [Anaerobacillus alkalidiazotrophicus]
MLKVATHTEIITDSMTLADMILQSEQYHKYKSTKKALQMDFTAEEMIWEFNKLKDKFEEVQRFGKYHPDYANVSKEVREMKRKLDLYDPIASFKKAEKQLEELLNEISLIIAHAVSDKIKVPTGNPFFDSMSCGGGCGAGGSCGCK